MRRYSWFGALATFLIVGASVQAQGLPGLNDPGNNFKLPIAELNRILPGGIAANGLPPLPGQPLPPWQLGNPYSPNFGPTQFGAMTPYPFQNPFTPSGWNYQAYNNPWNNYGWAGTGMWTSPPFGAYGYNGWGNYAPIVGANNGWWPYQTPFNNNGWNNGFNNNPFNNPFNNNNLWNNGAFGGANRFMQQFP